MVRNIKGWVLAGAVLVAAVGVQADVLYNIASFNNNNTETNVYWVAGITTITTAPGLTGTDDAGLLSLQTLRSDATTATGGAPRFRNTEPTQNGTRGSVTADKGDFYFQFGIVTDNVGESISLSSLSFQAVRATTTIAVRGYDIDVSINGGVYTDLGAENISNNRDDGLASYDLAVTDTGVTSVDFRVYTTGGGIEYTNFAVNGTVVPEPATLGLIAVFGGGILFIRRRFMI